MRIFLLFFPVFFFCGLLHAQTVKVEYGGDPLPDKDRKKIEQFLQHEVDFYSQFGLPDTLSLQQMCIRDSFLLYTFIRILKYPI